MKTFLITGVAGFLGSHLAERLLSLGNHVVGIDNLIGGYKENVPRECEFYEVDLNNFDEVKPLFKNVDTVVHSACTAYEGLSVFSPSLVVQNTFQITANALSASIQSGVNRFVFMSSMARYGSQSILPFTEDMNPAPQDPYGIAKYSSELLVKNLAEVHGMDFVILVPHNIIGPRQKFDDPYRNVASIMINRILHGLQPIIYGNGEQKRCFSFINDVVDPILVACNSENAIGEIINIGPDDEFVSINELAKAISRLMDWELRPIYVNERPQEVLQANCSADKARNLLGYEPQVTLESGLEELIAWIKQQPIRPFTYHLPIEILNEKTPKTWTQKLI
mgnify:CR=1 FL=1